MTMTIREYLWEGGPRKRDTLRHLLDLRDQLARREMDSSPGNTGEEKIVVLDPNGVQVGRATSWREVAELCRAAREGAR